MSSKSMRHRRNYGRRSISPTSAQPLHFMKIILPGSIHDQYIRLPKEFVRRFETELCTSEATIIVPDGHVWKIELKKSENEVLFCKGWDEFVKYYSLRLGFFLVFKYEGKSHFNVIIFDSTASEIYYHNTRSQKHKLDEEEEIIDIDIDDDNELTSHDVARKKLKNGSLSKNRQRSMEEMQNSESKNLPSFTITIRPAYLWYIPVPSSFWKVYLQKNGPMKLQDCEGRKWKVDYAKNGSTLRIGKGWISFARGNNVEVGDKCVFELIKRNKPFVFQVTIN